MKIEVAVVEDETVFLNQISSYIKEWKNNNYCQLHLKTFTSGENFLECFSTRYDLVFLDIEMGNITGLEVAKRLRMADYQGQIVFLTSFQEYVFEGYNVRALNYLLKPVTYNMIADCLNTVNNLLNDENYIYRYRDTIVKVPFREILYFSSCNHKTEIATCKNIYRQPGTLRDIMDLLPPRFVQCHRTTIVNMQHVIQVSGHNITLSNYTLLPISNTYIENIRRAFIAQIN